MQLRGIKIIVTGGASGLGLACAEGFAKKARRFSSPTATRRLGPKRLLTQASQSSTPT